MVCVIFVTERYEISGGWGGGIRKSTSGNTKEKNSAVITSFTAFRRFFLLWWIVIKARPIGLDLSRFSLYR